MRGAGYFAGIELVKDRDTKASFNDEESEVLLRGFLSGELFRRGLICRADDRGDPVIQLAPPLIASRRALRGDGGRAPAGARGGVPEDGPALGGAAVNVGVPTEIKTDEYRVALTPAGVRELVDDGHTVVIQAGAGEGSAIPDADYAAQGARIAPDAPTVFARGATDPRGQGAAARRGRAARAAPHAVHLPAPGRRRRS